VARSRQALPARAGCPRDLPGQFGWRPDEVLVSDGPGRSASIYPARWRALLALAKAGILAPAASIAATDPSKPVHSNELAIILLYTLSIVGRQLSYRRFRFEEAELPGMSRSSAARCKCPDSVGSS
jgi:hypothetical protein